MNKLKGTCRSCGKPTFGARETGLCRKCYQGGVEKEQDTTITSDGKIHGPLPITLRRNI